MVDAESVRAGLVRKGLDLILSIVRAEDERALAQRTAAIAFSIRVVSAAVAYFMQVLLARWMGGFEYGIYVFVWVWVLVAGSIAGLGWNTSVLRFVPEYHEKNDLGRIRGFIHSGRWITLGTATIMALAGGLGIYLLGDWIESYYVLPFYLALFCLPFFALTDIHDGLARSYSWVDIALVPPYLVRPLLILGLMAGALLLGFPANASVALGAAIGGTWLAAFVQAIVLHGRLKTKVPTGPKTYDNALWLRVSLPFVLVEGFYIILSHTDILVLGGFVDPDQIAIYFAVIRTIGLVSFVPFAVTAAVTHRFSQLNAAGDRDGLAVFVRDAVNWTFWPSLAAAAFILALGYPALMLFGDGFTTGYPLMFILALGILVRASVGLVESLLNMLGHQVVCAQILVGTVAFNLVANLTLIPFFGLYGAAMATTMSVILESGLLFTMVKRRAGITMVIGNKL